MKLAAMGFSAGGVLSRFGNNASGGMLLRMPSINTRAIQSTPDVSNNLWETLHRGNHTAEHMANTTNSARAQRQRTPAEDIKSV